MFKPNRVGTPHIHNATDVASTATITPNLSSINQLYTGNVINATPTGDFGQVAIRWTGANCTVTAFQRMAIGQQFTITAPIQGDTVGVEIGGSILINIPVADAMFGCFFKVDTAANGVWGNVTAITPATIVKTDSYSNAAIRHATYQTQIVVNGSNVAGTYFHGIAIQDAGSDAVFSALHAEMYVRQLNDQQNISYRDTRR